MAAFEYFKYFLELKDVKKRYEEILNVADCTKDLYCYLESKITVSGSVEWSKWPDVMSADIYNYLVVLISLYTCEQIKAYKSLDRYNFFINGWVQLTALQFYQLVNKRIICYSSC